MLLSVSPTRKMRLLLLLLLVVSSTALAVKVITFDAHSHYRLGWDQPIMVNESLAWHRKYGFKSLAFTEHSPWMGDGRPFNDLFMPLSRMNVDPTMPVLPGVEWTARSLHVLVYFDPNSYGAVREVIRDNPRFRVFWSFPICSNMTEYCLLANRTHLVGGILGVAHHSISVLENASKGKEGCPVPSLDQVYGECHFDFIEVANTVLDYDAVRFARANNITMVAGTDVHRFDLKWDSQSPVSYTNIHLRDSEPVNPKSIFDALKDGRTSVDVGAKQISRSVRNILIVMFSALGAVIAGVATKLGCRRKQEAEQKLSAT